MGRRTFAAAAAVVGLVAGCTTSGNESPRAPSVTAPSGATAETPSDSSPPVTRTAPARSTARPTPAAASHGLVYHADLVSNRFVIFAVGPTPDGHGRARLFATTVAGKQLRDIGPRHMRSDLYPDRIFALDPRHIWFDVFSGGGGSERLYRTRDGGRTWRSARVPGHVLAAGSTDDLQFVSAKRGWLAVEQPTGPEEELYRSTDSGATWQQVQHLRVGDRMAGLPDIGDVWFAAGTGWLGGSSFGRPVYSSADGGRHWQRAALPASRDSSYELPAVFGSTVLAPVLSCAHHVRTVRIYRRDAAGIWSSPESSWQLPGLPAPRFGCGQFSVAMPSRQVAWAVAFGGRTAVVGRTVDGRHWARAADPAPSASFATIHATDARHAWVLADGRPYVTADGGKSWRRVRVP